MKRLLAVAAVSGALFAACGDDKKDFRDQLIDQARDLGGVVDERCIDDALEPYSGDDLDRFDDELNGDSPSDEARALVVALQACVRPPSTT